MTYFRWKWWRWSLWHINHHTGASLIFVQAWCGFEGWQSFGDLQESDTIPVGERLCKLCVRRQKAERVITRYTIAEKEAKP